MTATYIFCDPETSVGGGVIQRVCLTLSVGDRVFAAVLKQAAALRVHVRITNTCARTCTHTVVAVEFRNKLSKTERTKTNEAVC